LHSYRPRQGEPNASEEEPEFESFESAWEAIQAVPEELLNDFEDELWETQSRRLIYGTKHASVIDAVEPIREGGAAGTAIAADHQPTRVVRYLILNERPNLIQTAVEVLSVGAPYKHYFRQRRNDGSVVDDAWMALPPPPVSRTHLGGLAMALPLWHKANTATDNKAAAPTRTAPNEPFAAPNCLLIGAGGCSLAHTLAANLFLEKHNQKNADDDPESMPRLTAVEASPEILKASELWFGAKSSEKDDEKDDEKTNENHGETARSPEPPFFDLVHDTGESYLASLVESSEREGETSLIDILIVDAEDGTAPPRSMRTPEFWQGQVLPSLNLTRSPIVAVNAIGTDSEVSELVRTMQTALCGNGSGNDCVILVVDPPPEAGVTDRHKLVFALFRDTTSKGGDPDPGAVGLGIAEDDLRGHVDAPGAWKPQIEAALRTAFANI